MVPARAGRPTLSDLQRRVEALERTLVGASVDGAASGERSAELDRPWAPLSDRLQALGHPVRLELLRAMLAGSSSTADLVLVLGAGSTGQLYHHLTQLTAAGWVRTAGRGRVEVPDDRREALLAVIGAVR